MTACSAVFLVHLVQDVNVVRPLVFMAARDFQCDTLLLVAKKFLARDVLGIWRSELETIASEAGASICYFHDDWDAHHQLNGSGLLISASESDLPNHVIAHNVFQYAGPNYLRVTLQHGFECVGFRHSADHVRAHGETASFAADLLCAWADADHLPSLAASQRQKVIVTGPSFVLQQYDRLGGGKRAGSGLVCENLHSVRFAGVPKAKADFINTLAEFSRMMSVDQRPVTLRPHPGGQYYLKNRSAVPPNVSIEIAPSYRLDLRRYDYGISAPSSVLIEMLVAGIPTAVWRDPLGDIDADAYRGLATVGSATEWAEFARAATSEPERFLDRQTAFLERSGMPLDPRDVYLRFAQLFQSAANMTADFSSELARPGGH